MDDDIIIGAVNGLIQFRVTVQSDIVVNSLKLQSGSLYTNGDSQSGIFTVTSELHQSGGSLEGSGVFIIPSSGTFNWTGGEWTGFGITQIFGTLNMLPDDPTQHLFVS